MGNSPSTPRTYTVDNDIITASNQVVERLFSGYPSSHVEASKQSTDAVVPLTESSSEGFSIEHYEPIVPTMEMQQDKALELENNDKYWSKRFKQFEAELFKTNQIMDKEYKLAVEEVNKRFHYQPKIGKKTNCSDMEKQLIECYKKNPNEALNCAQAAKDYSNCVQKFSNAAKNVLDSKTTL